MKLLSFIYDNWQWFAGFMVFVTILALTGSITRTLKAAIEGLKQALTPFGFLVLLALIIIAIIIYFKVKAVIAS